MSSSTLSVGPSDIAVPRPATCHPKLPTLYEMKNHPKHKGHGRALYYLYNGSFDAARDIYNLEVKELKIPQGSANEAISMGYLELFPGDIVFSRLEGSRISGEDDVAVVWVTGSEIYSADLLTKAITARDEALGPRDLRSRSHAIVDPDTGVKVGGTEWERVMTVEYNKDRGRCYPFGCTFQKWRSLYSPCAAGKVSTSTKEVRDMRGRFTEAVTAMAMISFEQGPSEIAKAVRVNHEIYNTPCVGVSNNYAFTSNQLNLAHVKEFESEESLAENMGEKFGGAHIDERDSPGHYTNMIALSDLPDGCDPGRFFIVYPGVFCTLNNFVSVNFSGLRVHGGSPPIAAPGTSADDLKWGTRVTAVCYAKIGPTSAEHKLPLFQLDPDGVLSVTPEVLRPGKFQLAKKFNATNFVIEGPTIMKPSSVMLFLTRCLLLLMITILSQLPNDMDAKIDSDAFLRSFSYVDSDGRRRRVRPWISGPGWRSARSIANDTDRLREDEDDLVDQADKVTEMRAVWDKHQQLCGGHIPSAVCCVPKIPPLVGWSEGDPFVKIAPIPFGDGKRKKKTDTVQNSEQQPDVVDSSDEEPGVAKEEPRRSRRNKKNKRKAPAAPATSAPKATSKLSKSSSNATTLPVAGGQPANTSTSLLPVVSTTTAAPIIASSLDVLRLSRIKAPAGLGSTPAQGVTASATVASSAGSGSSKAPLGIAGSVLHALGLLDPSTGRSIKGKVATCSPMPRVPSGSSVVPAEYKMVPGDTHTPPVGEHKIDIAKGNVPSFKLDQTAPSSVSSSSSHADSLFGDCLDSLPDIANVPPVGRSVTDVSTETLRDSSSMESVAAESGPDKASADSDLIASGHQIQGRKSIEQAAKSPVEPEDSGIKTISSTTPYPSATVPSTKTGVILSTNHNTGILSSSNTSTPSPPSNTTTTSTKRRRSTENTQQVDASDLATREGGQNSKRRRTKINNDIVSPASGTTLESAVSVIGTQRPAGKVVRSATPHANSREIDGVSDRRLLAIQAVTTSNINQNVLSDDQEKRNLQNLPKFLRKLTSKTIHLEYTRMKNGLVSMAMRQEDCNSDDAAAALLKNQTTINGRPFEVSTLSSVQNSWWAIDALVIAHRKESLRLAVIRSCVMTTNAAAWKWLLITIPKHIVDIIDLQAPTSWLSQLVIKIYNSIRERAKAVYFLPSHYGIKLLNIRGVVIDFDDYVIPHDKDLCAWSKIIIPVVEEILKVWLEYPTAGDSKWKAIYAMNIIETLGPDFMFLDCVWNTYDSARHSLVQHCSLPESLDISRYPVLNPSSALRKDVESIGRMIKDYKAGRLYLYMDYGAQMPLSVNCLSEEMKSSVDQNRNDFKLYIQQCYSIIFHHADIRNKDMQDFLEKFPDKYSPFREYAPTRTNMTRNDVDGPFSPKYLYTEVGVFSALVCRGVTFGTKFSQNGRTLFTSPEDFDHAVAVLKQDQYCDPGAYGQGNPKRLPGLVHIYWDALKKSPWPGIGGQKRKQITFEDAYEYFYPKGTKVRFPELGPLGAYLLTVDYVYAGVVEFPTARGLATIISKLNRAPARALHHLGFVLPKPPGRMTSKQREERLSTFEVGLESTYQLMKESIPIDFHAKAGLDLFVAEHALCKFMRSKFGSDDE